MGEEEDAPLHDADIASCWLQFGAPMARADFEAAFAGLLDQFGPDILRAKGLVEFAGNGPSFVQYVGGGVLQIEAANLAPDPARPSGIVVIGSNVTTGALADIFAAHGLGQYFIKEDHSGHAHPH